MVLDELLIDFSVLSVSSVVNKMIGQDINIMRREPRKLFFKHIVRKAILEDWGLKLTALVITLGLWFGVTGLSTPQYRSFTVPLNINLANNTEITNTNLPQDV